jgi:hypothetical protein
MKATLIEIDCGAPEALWYARHPGLRLWAQKSYFLGRVLAWNVLPGQDALCTCGINEPLWVNLEHAWQVREGDVELRLIEIPSAAGPAA